MSFVSNNYPIEIFRLKYAWLQKVMIYGGKYNALYNIFTADILLSFNTLLATYAGNTINLTIS